MHLQKSLGYHPLDLASHFSEISGIFPQFWTGNVKNTETYRNVRKISMFLPRYVHI